jgi:hypothetical protein
MGQRASVHIEVDMRNPLALQVLAEDRPYIVKVRGSKPAEHYCANANAVRALMVPSGTVGYGPFVPPSVRPQLYV